MKNLLIYYFAITLPLPLMYYYALENPIIFVFLLFSYVILRGFLDGQRLIDKKILKQNEIWKAFIPFWTARYFRQLYFEK